jgi:hypothetical protein
VADRTSKTASVRPEDILDDHTDEVRALTEQLRSLIKETIPEATERAYPGWHGIGYRHPEAGFFAAIFPRADDVKLGFEHGADLPDPDGLLTGEGKRVRYVVVRRPGDIRSRAIGSLLIAAIHRLPG